MKTSRATSGERRSTVKTYDSLLDLTRTASGSWSVTPNHDICYKSSGDKGEIKFKGSLVSAEPDLLVLAVTEKISAQKISTHLVELTGKWSLNDKNQITFAVERETGKDNVLTFKGGWKVNGNNEIVYTYRSQALRTRTKIVQDIVFKGFWDISANNRLTYYLAGDSESAFEFRGAFATKSASAKHGELCYQAGVGVKGGKARGQTITLFGTWAVTKDLELAFSAQYSDKKTRTMTFGADYKLNSTTAVSAELKSETGKPLGARLVITKDIFGKDGQMFLRLQRCAQEGRVEAGVRFRW